MKLTRFLRYWILLPLCVLLLPWGMGSCENEGVLCGDDVKLAFSEDTLKFDTVFVARGTVTKQVKVYNNLSQTVHIDAITLKGGAASRFRLNVDGDTSMVVRNVDIAAHDSIFIFVRACINPNSQLEPFLVEDAIVFDCGGNRKNLVLTAYGRNAVYHTPTNSFSDQYGNVYNYSVIDCDGWDHSRPHVIEGYAVVDSRCTLNLTAGDELYFGTDAVLWVFDSATLKVQGTPERPVLFTSVRHDDYYGYLPGQWNYIWLYSGSKDNVIDWARIENGYVGLLVDTNVNQNPTLKITNTVVENHSNAGLLARGAVVEGDNLLLDNCGGACMALQYGGSYSISNSTLSGNYRWGARVSPTLVLNNWYVSAAGDTILRDLRRADFKNCIVYGNYSDRWGAREVAFILKNGAQANYSFRHCLLKTDNASLEGSGNILNEDPLFLDVKENNLHVAAESPALGAGNAAYVNIPYDLDYQPRQNPPAMGAYEYRDTTEAARMGGCKAMGPARTPAAKKKMPPMRVERGNLKFKI